MIFLLHKLGEISTLKKNKEQKIALFSPKTKHPSLLAQKWASVFSPKMRGIAVFSPKGGLFHHKGLFPLNRGFNKSFFYTCFSIGGDLTIPY